MSTQRITVSGRNFGEDGRNITAMVAGQPCRNLLMVEPHKQFTCEVPEFRSENTRQLVSDCVWLAIVVMWPHKIG